MFSIKMFETIASMQQKVSELKSDEKSIAFVPTMGNLHAGHMRLFEKAKQLGDKVVASIFVNPLQFGEYDDFVDYPRTLVDDMEKLSSVGVDYLFVPSINEIYPDGLLNHTLVSTPKLTEILCGKSRPGHFDGVVTVVLKLFNIIQPDFVVFGEKDYQQLCVIRKLVNDFCLNIEVVSVPIERDVDGFALSSRNRHLSSCEREVAPSLHRILIELKEKISAGDKDFITLTANAKEKLEGKGFSVDYIEVYDKNLREITSQTKEFVVLVAAFLGTTRLIDNIVFKVNG